ncbi:MAG: hypothetical protein IH587_01045 [Anaerolineae bacterium]|nr:hypothetical protein [Anaerolineae bacterium]
MSQSLSFEALYELDDLEVVVDGVRLFEIEQKTPSERIVCTIVCHGTRLVGSALLVLAALMIAFQQALDAFYVGIFGLTLLVGGLVGLRQFQNASRRLVLDKDKLTFLDNWNNIYREFPRSACLEVYCERDGDRCDVRVTHPNHTVNVVIEALPSEIAQQIANRLNQRLQSARSERLIPAAQRSKVAAV